METQLKSEEELNDKILNLVVSRGVNGVTAKEAKELLGVSEGLSTKLLLELFKIGLLIRYEEDKTFVYFPAGSESELDRKAKEDSDDDDDDANGENGDSDNGSGENSGEVLEPEPEKQAHLFHSLTNDSGSGARNQGEIQVNAKIRRNGTRHMSTYNRVSDLGIRERLYIVLHIAQKPMTGRDILQAMGMEVGNIYSYLYEFEKKGALAKEKKLSQAAHGCVRDIAFYSLKRHKDWEVLDKIFSEEEGSEEVRHEFEKQVVGFLDQHPEALNRALSFSDVKALRKKDAQEASEAYDVDFGDVGKNSSVGAVGGEQEKSRPSKKDGTKAEAARHIETEEEFEKKEGYSAVDLMNDGFYQELMKAKREKIEFLKAKSEKFRVRRENIRQLDLEIEALMADFEAMGSFDA